MWYPPGFYARTLPGLDYEWDLVWTDNSAVWDWEIADAQGCYDALRVYLGELPRQHGVKKYEITLADIPVEPRLEFLQSGWLPQLGYERSPTYSRLG